MYTIFNQLLELLLMVDMIYNVLRSFYNEQGVLVYALKSIRVKYFSSNFLIDLFAAMPFQILVQVCSFKCHISDTSSHKSYQGASLLFLCLPLQIFCCYGMCTAHVFSRHASRQYPR